MHAALPTASIGQETGNLTLAVQPVISIISPGYYGFQFLCPATGGSPCLIEYLHYNAVREFGKVYEFNLSKLCFF
jgi:hypothetical protein